MSTDERKFTLKKPVEIGEGESKKTITEIDLTGLDQVTGADINKCIREAQSAKGELVRVLALDVDLHMQIAALVSGHSMTVMNKLGGRDYVEVATLVQNFLTGSD
jgi:hypothetical protein